MFRAALFFGEDRQQVLFALFLEVQDLVHAVNEDWDLPVVRQVFDHEVHHNPDLPFGAVAPVRLVDVPPCDVFLLHDLLCEALCFIGL